MILTSRNTAYLPDLFSARGLFAGCKLHNCPEVCGFHARQHSGAVSALEQFCRENCFPLRILSNLPKFELVDYKRSLISN